MCFSLGSSVGRRREAGVLHSALPLTQQAVRAVSALISNSEKNEFKIIICDIFTILYPILTLFMAGIYSAITIKRVYTHCLSL